MSAPYSTKHTRPTMGGRLEGFDILRGLGALLVVLSHAFLLIPHELPFYSEGMTWRVVYWGNIFLEAFFAMSGFLIGGELLREIMHQPDGRLVAAYVTRRWTRTLPAYYVILVLLLAYEALRTGIWPAYWGHVFFVQAYTGTLDFYGVSWTLAVEQWSYVLLPLIILGLQRALPECLPPLRRVMLVALLVIAVMLVLRCLTLWAVPQTIMDEGVRKQPHLRLDALMYGLLLACCKESFPQLYTRLQSAWCLVLTALAALALVELQYHDRFIRNVPNEMRRLFHAGFGFTIMGILGALPLPFLEKKQSVRGLSRYVPRAYALLQSASLHSYSLYLIHFSVLIEIMRLHSLWRRDNPLWNSVLFLLVMTCAAGLCILLTRLSFLCVEKTGMALRKPIITSLIAK